MALHHIHLIEIGCNGSGKTTLINQLKRLLDKEKITYTSFDNLFDGGENARSWAGYTGDFSFLATAVMSSEGENILMNIGNYSVKFELYDKLHSMQKELDSKNNEIKNLQMVIDELKMYAKLSDDELKTLLEVKEFDKKMYGYFSKIFKEGLI